MLSGESAFGDYPVESISTMAKILTSTEVSPLDKYTEPTPITHQVDKQLILAHALIHMGFHAKVGVIAVSDAKLAAGLSHFRPDAVILLIAKNHEAVAAATLLWGVIPMVTSAAPASIIRNLDLGRRGERFLSALGLAKEASVELI
jgi:pyruvate kinase